MEKKSIGKKILMFFWEAFKIIFMLAICAFIGIFYAVGERAGSSKRFVEEYFTYYMTNNYDGMYKMIDVDNSDFVSKDNFVNKCEGEKIYGSMTDYSIGKGVENGNSITYVVTYYLNEEKTPNTYTITINKQKKHTYLFFNTWKVSVKRFMVDDFTVSTPIGSKTTLDGIDISSYKDGTSEDGTLDIYKINTIFTGDHTLTVTDTANGSVSKTQYIKKNDESMQLTVSDFTMKGSEQSDIESYARLVITSMYTYAMDGTSDYTKILEYFDGNAATQEIAANCFNQLKADIQRPDGASLRKINIETMTSGLQSFTYPDKAIINVNYSYSYNAVSSTSILGGVAQYYSGKGDSAAVLAFEKIDGVWKITAIDMKCIPYVEE